MSRYVNSFTHVNILTVNAVDQSEQVIHLDETVVRNFQHEMGRTVFVSPFQRHLVCESNVSLVLSVLSFLGLGG